MNDHEWLSKLRVAYKEYCRQHPCEELPATIFVQWVFEQYGHTFDDQPNN